MPTLVDDYFVDLFAGAVFGYDEEGVQIARGRSSWKQCVTIMLVDQYDDDIKEIWDKNLQQIARSKEWTHNRYGLFTFCLIHHDHYIVAYSGFG